jgi:DNA topoisomerase-1
MTANLESEMEEVEHGNKKKAEVVEDSRKMLLTIIAELKGAEAAVGEKIRKALWARVSVGKCPTCGKDLVIISTNRGTRFVGCSGYKDGCRTAFPLPAKGKITPLDKLCPDCNMPTIEVQYFQKRPFRMCILPTCKSKAGWGKKKEAKAVKAAEKKAKTPRKRVKKVAPAPRLKTLTSDDHASRD